MGELAPGLSSFLNLLLKDFRFAFRSLVRDRAFTIAAVVTLTLGLSCTIGVFALVNSVLINPLGFPDADRVVVFLRTTPWGDLPSVSYPNFQDWRSQQRSFVDLALTDYTEFNLAGASKAMRLMGRQVTPGFFTVIAYRPVLGSLFPEDSVEKSRRLAILSHKTWQEGFGGDTSVVGRPIRLNDQLYEICGVLAPAGANFLDADVWVPVDLASENGIARRRSASVFEMVGRLKSNVTPQQAQAEINVLSRRLEKTHPEIREHLYVHLKGLKELQVGDTRPRLLALLGAVCFVLLIACLNTGSLLITRGTARAREVAVRCAMGASRGRLLRQFLLESLVLATAGTIGGILTARVGIQLLQFNFPQGVPRLEEATFDSHVVLFAVAALGLSVLLFGLLPALRSSRVSLVGALKEGAAASTSSPASVRLRTLLVISQVALSAILVIGAGLLIKSYWLLNSVDLGFKTEGLITAQTVLSPTRYKTPADKARFQRDAEERLKSLPGVVGVGAANNLTFSNWSFSIHTDYELPGGETKMLERASFKMVSPGFFQALGIPLVFGRSFDGRDMATAPPVMILDRKLAAQMVPGGQALNTRVKFLDDRWWTVVGIVDSLREQGPLDEHRSTLYVPFDQYPADRVGWAIKTSSPPAAMIPEIRRTLGEIDPDQPIYSVRTMREMFYESISEHRFNTCLMFGFAAVALALAAVGLYGVLAYQVVSRTREIGIRMAIGAGSGRVFRQIAGDGLKLVSIGLAAGLLASLGLTRFLATMLFGVRPLDWYVFLTVACVLVGVGIAALGVPAWRASRVNPSLALRSE